MGVRGLKNEFLTGVMYVDGKVRMKNMLRSPK